MNVMVLDLELNQNGTPKIIEVGAAAYCARTGKQLETISILVNPNEPLTPEIVTLTGINNSDLSNGVSVKEAYEMLRSFHKKHKCFMNPLVWGSGERNDSLALYLEAMPNREEDNFMGRRVIDVKSQYQSRQMIVSGKIVGGLEKACDTLGIGFEGRPHRALPDAVNTFRVWWHLNKVYKS